MKAKQLPAAILSIKDKGTTGVTISPFQNVRGRSKKEKENKLHCHKKGWGITITLISRHQHPLQRSCTHTAPLLHCYLTLQPPVWSLGPRSIPTSRAGGPRGSLASPMLGGAAAALERAITQTTSVTPAGPRLQDWETEQRRCRALPEQVSAECWLSPHTDCPLSPLPCWHTQDALCSGANCMLDHPTAAKRTYRRGSLPFSYNLKLPGAPACARAFAHCWH